MKKLSVLALSAALMSTPALAESGENYTVNPATSQVPSSVDLSAVFENSDSLQVAILSKQEMEETKGAVFDHRGGGAGGFGSGGGAGFGARLGNLGSGKIGTKLGKIGENSKFGTQFSVDYKAAAAGGIAGGVLNLNSYAKDVPANQKTRAGYITSFTTGALGGSITGGMLSLGAARATVVGVGTSMAGNNVSIQHLRGEK